MKFEALLSSLMGLPTSRMTKILKTTQIQELIKEKQAISKTFTRTTGFMNRRLITEMYVCSFFVLIWPK